MDIAADKYIQIVTNQRNNALNEAAQLAAMVDTLTQHNQTLSTKLEEAQKKIDELTPKPEPEEKT